MPKADSFKSLGRADYVCVVNYAHRVFMPPGMRWQLTAIRKSTGDQVVVTRETKGAAVRALRRIMARLGWWEKI